MFIPRKAVALPSSRRTIDDHWIGGHSDEVTAQGNLQRILHCDMLLACLPLKCVDLCACVPDLQDPLGSSASCSARRNGLGGGNRSFPFDTPLLPLIMQAFLSYSTSFTSAPSTKWFSYHLRSIVFGICNLQNACRCDFATLDPGRRDPSATSAIVSPQARWSPLVNVGIIDCLVLAR
jgi:hypothetical protein